MLKILHIAAHYGGGVGTVINSWTQNDKNNTHIVTFLNTKVNNHGEVFKTDLVCDSDIVVCHFWNHPATYNFLVNTTLPPCRLILWSHISGLFPPYTYFGNLVDYSNMLVFTTPLSYDCKEIKELSQDRLDKITTVWSTCGVERFKDIKRKAKPDFTVGITGTIDYGKLHKDFIEMCTNIKPTNIKFVVCSTDSQQHLIDKAAELRSSDRFLFAGRVEDVKDYLPNFDVFGYPLQQTHFGSCEQGLGEAMMCGCVPVVFNNPSERYIVKNMENGLVVSSKEEYCKAIEYLYRNREELKRMSCNAVLSAKKLYDVRGTIVGWDNIFDRVMKSDKKLRQWSYAKYEPWMIYAVSMGSYGKPFFDYVFYDQLGDDFMREECITNIKKLYSTNSMFYSNRKGSIKQYLDYFPDDIYIRQWERFL